jgi:KipI family sensor histidine kinase inhibitor
MSQVLIEPLGDHALLIRLGDCIDIRLNRAALALADALRAAALPGVRDIAPAYASVAVRYEPGAWADSPYERITAWVDEIVYKLQEGAPPEPLTLPSSPSQATGKRDLLEIPVCYGGEFGPDLEDVAVHAGLTADEVVAQHVDVEYRVAMLGFMPGFPYLLGLDSSLHTPRRSTPRTRVPAGSVAIGGAQTGIYPRELPGGWQLIGRTPLSLFEPARTPPALLRPGQCVRFRAIRAAEFASLR